MAPLLDTLHIVDSDEEFEELSSQEKDTVFCLIGGDLEAEHVEPLSDQLEDLIKGLENPDIYRIEDTDLIKQILTGTEMSIHSATDDNAFPVIFFKDGDQSALHMLAAEEEDAEDEDEDDDFQFATKPPSLRRIFMLPSPALPASTFTRILSLSVLFPCLPDLAEELFSNAVLGKGSRGPRSTPPHLLHFLPSLLLRLPVSTMKVISFAISLSSFALLVSGHKEDSSPEAIAAFKSRQASIYHCAPQIAAYVAERKAAAQKVLGMAPTDPATMFLEGAFEKDEPGKKKVVLECEEAPEAKIRNHTCVLSPVVTQGPYYHDRGHPIRQNMAEVQLGLPFLIDIGVINVRTCEPIPNILVDIWHANATGHYAGHPEQEEKLKWEGPAHEGSRKGLLSKYPRTKPEETWLRGAWPTNKNGVSQFTSIFPGYYTGRATHVHVKIHSEYEPHANGTFTSGKLHHIGQFFVPDELNEVVDKVHPYTMNPIKDKWGRTRNWDDSLQIYQDSHRNGYGPTFELEQLGGVIQQGVIGYISVGIDLEASYDPTEAWKP